ncbi:MAG TPA: 4-hydroxythreonine-4-phosphate dehydrogenase PdxA [Caulobacteraceae bacterium]|nr:4-hydroxythreonine-4-phosphate dehydrogenase PdxA [Caulobacteraceae bacterium]
MTGRATPGPIAVSLGDPAGIGPEIVLKAWQALHEAGDPFFVVGDRQVLAETSSQVPLAVIGSATEAAAAFGQALPVIDIPLAGRAVPGRPSSDYAGQIIAWIETAVRMALEGAASAVVTAPISKAPLYAAGFKFPGHTEFLGELTAGAPMSGPRGPIMMLAAGDLRTVPVTIHEPYAKAPERLTTELIVHAGEVTAAALVRDFAIQNPRLALAGLNPHAGESGAIGREEIEIIAPAAAILRDRGIDCTDPKPADTLFHPQARATYDAVLCMYHDQALIPVKMLDFWGGVNITLGLPIVRVSPDHGVGYDIAGRGRARADSLIAALKLARQIAARRQGDQ